MNLIPCGKKCVNQKDGYCILKGISALQTTEKDCLYFQQGSPSDTDPELFPHVPENVGDGADPN